MKNYTQQDVIELINKNKIIEKIYTPNSEGWVIKSEIGDIPFGVFMLFCRLNNIRFNNIEIKNNYKDIIIEISRFEEERCRYRRTIKK